MVFSRFWHCKFQFVEEKSWVNDFIKFKLGVDGISILFIVLTTFIAICIISCINSVKTRVKEFLIAILILETFMIGVFCALDLVIFYLFFEAGLIPMFLIIGVWGGQKSLLSFQIFSIHITWLCFNASRYIFIYWLTGTTDITQIYEIKIPKEYQNLLWLAFLSSFAVKMPMCVTCSFQMLMLKLQQLVQLYLRDTIKNGWLWIFKVFNTYVPNSIRIFYTLIYTLSIIAIIYTSLVALMQDDMKKLIAYSSVAHMGYVTLEFLQSQNKVLKEASIR